MAKLTGSRGSFFGNSASSLVKHPVQSQDIVQLMTDLNEVRRALDLFLNSHIKEAEDILRPRRKTSMYHSLGHSFILFLKCMMTFEEADNRATIEALKQTLQLANDLRKSGTGWFDITSWVKTPIQSMNTIQRHAELVHAEAYLLKALITTVHDDSVMSFLREGLNIRSSYNTYCSLESCLKTGENDEHFQSGVALGVGCFNLILSMLPPSVIRVAEFIGFSADRAHGVAVLESVSRASKDQGLRRQLCDMVIILYHLVLSKMMPLNNVDEVFAQKILDYNLKRYPSGVFFVYFHGRLLASQGKLEEAKAEYRKAIETQKDWKQLQHMCFWELGVIALAQQQWEECFSMFDTLSRESQWSKSVYNYLKAVALNKQGKDVTKLMKQVTATKQKIGGKSLPMEKFVSRKSRKFLAQDGLIFSDLEILNAFSIFDLIPEQLLLQNLELINQSIQTLDSDAADDICLAYYLRALVARTLTERYAQDKRTLHQQSLEMVFANAPKVQLDHYIYYFARYESARMLILDSQFDEAEAEIQVILRADEKGVYNVGAGPHAKSKYSMANALVFRCHNALAKIQSMKKNE
ncbi:hypothetical protein DFQ28_004071 [Apophysomyces sp. BC1034]|nr:hypothetical protein DFQ30_009378 [Apophysomyces sp. BC1015]KAG0178077.1 hypothetical protein DFQ29_003982 [Apophysomyces sp. BC1021]KAG0193630.1 hypothetical protein DFQ28_004071 [Apophysomyces sp. BC1034]